MPRFVVSGLFVLLTATVGLGQHMIAVDSSRAMYEIDVATGAKTSIGTVSANAGTTAGLAIGAANVVFLTSTSLDSLFRRFSTSRRPPRRSSAPTATPRS